MARNFVKNKRVVILGVEIDSITRSECLDLLTKWIAQKKKKWLVTANPEIVLQAFDNKSYRLHINQADLCLADGIGLLFAATYLEKMKSSGRNPGKRFLTGLSVGVRGFMDQRYLQKQLPEVVSGDVLVNKLLEIGNNLKWKIYLLGARKGVGQEAIEKIQRSYSDLDIIANSGAENIRQETEEECKKIIDEINEFEPDILLVGYGAPWQEKWIQANKQRISAHVIMGVGGTIDQLAGKVPETPGWLRNRGLRWLWRLILEPQRWRRILTATLLFPWKVFRQG